MKETLNSLQYLRGIAASLVVVHHAREQLPYLREIVASPFGSAGVDLFFVISGFIMVYVTQSANIRAADFWLKRIIRVAPLYWFFTSVFAGMLLLFPKLFNSAEFGVANFIASILFFPLENWEGRVRPLISIGWTLNYEMFFYAVFSISIVLSKGTIGRVLIISALFGALVLGRFFIWHDVSNAQVQFLSYPIILEFCFGMLLACLFTSTRVKVSKSVALPLLAAGVLMFINSSINMPESRDLRPFYFGIPALAIVAASLFIERADSMGQRKPNRLLMKLGDASYSIYLSHIFTLGICRYAVSFFGLEIRSFAPAILFMLGAFVCSLLVGVLTYELVEKRLTALLRRGVRLDGKVAIARATN